MKRKIALSVLVTINSLKKCCKNKFILGQRKRNALRILSYANRPKKVFA